MYSMAPTAIEFPRCARNDQEALFTALLVVPLTAHRSPLTDRLTARPPDRPSRSPLTAHPLPLTAYL
jgi:hypothetical protein